MAKFLRVPTGVLLTVLLLPAPSLLAADPLVDAVNIRVNYALPLAKPEKMDRHVFTVPERGRYKADLIVQADDTGAFERLGLHLNWALGVFRVEDKNGEEKIVEVNPWIVKPLSEGTTLTQEFDAEKGDKIMVPYYTTLAHRSLVGETKGFPAPQLLASLRVQKIGASSPAKEDVEILKVIDTYNALPGITRMKAKDASRFEKECTGEWMHKQLAVVSYGVMGANNKKTGSAKSEKCVLVVFNRQVPETTTFYLVYFKDRKGPPAYRAFKKREDFMQELAGYIDEAR